MSRAGFDPARRAFLRGAPLTGEGRAGYRREQRRLGPRPPCLPEAGEAACADCDAPCIRSCPARIIRRHGPEHRLSGTAYLWFEQAGCTFCGACAAVCPQSQAPQGTPSPGAAHLDPDRCLSWNGVVCLSCVSRCPVRALVRDSRARVAVDSGRCTGCGQCVSACPVEAIAVRSA
ncbi:MAG: 4Fe-4S dicluster domain-containing protein [Chromatiales bacterium]|jgi:ferredoxin-type protein NapF